MGQQRPQERKRTMSRRCKDCQIEVEDIQPGDPCPSCGSIKREIVVHVESAVIAIQVVSPTIVIGPPANTPGVLLSAVVDFGARVPDGDMIVAVLPAWRQIIDILNSDPAAVLRMDPRKWEEIIAASYEAAGFDEVILTPASGDLGRDVIAVKQGFFTVRIIDQVKRYAPGNPVPADDVRALLGVLLSDEKATKGIVTTTSTFAPRIAEEENIMKYVPNRLELIDGDALIPRLKAIADGRLKA
jgi:restriction system protein